MTIGAIGSRSALGVQSLVDMRKQLDDLQQQLGTGKKADTYAGIGIGSGFAVGLRAQASAFGAFDDSITAVNVRLNLAQTTLGRIGDIGNAVKDSAFKTASVGTGSTSTQSSAASGLDEILGLLNSQAGDRYLFSGSAADKPAVESLDHIMNGDGARAGLKQVIAERQQADLGANGLGRLVISAPTAASVKVAEDVAGSPFGLKLAGVNATLSNTTVSGPAGVPPGISVALTGLPNAGDNVQLRFTLPDGSSESIMLTATSSSPPGANEFTIGATPAATAANLQAALTTSLGQLADTSLKAASAMQAGDDFFGDPPQRVAGSPLNTATALVAGTPSDTVSWYTGENGAGSARAAASARVDPSISVSYGMRANELGIRALVQNVATLAAMTFLPNDPNAAARSVALNQRVGASLEAPTGAQKISDIQADLANTQATLSAATDRHRQTQATLSDMIQQIENVPPEQVAAQILALQTRLQASLQTTALLYQTSLVKYL
jgi:flagellar hook-associated protein 3 FlgL